MGVGKKLLNEKIKTPFFWLGHVFQGRPVPWLEFPVEGIIVNAFEIFKKKKICREILGGKSLREILPNPGKILIALDSGGFLFQKSPEIKIPFEDFISIVQKAQPDLVFALDHPLDPSLGVIDNNRRIRITLKNTRKMVQQIKDVPIVPIMHGYTKNQLDLCAKGINNIYNESPSFIACGSLVPLMRTSGKINPAYLKNWDTDSRRVMAIRILKYVKKLFPKSQMHVFGIGGTNIMHLMYLIAESVDSIGWRWSAAGGMVRIFGVGERYISDRKENVRWNPNLNDVDWEMLRKCKCPACHNNQDTLKSSFEARAIHNAYVYQEETKLARNLMKEGNYYEFISNRMKSNNTLKNLVREFQYFN